MKLFKFLIPFFILGISVILIQFIGFVTVALSIVGVIGLILIWDLIDGKKENDWILVLILLGYLSIIGISKIL